MEQFSEGKMLTRKAEEFKDEICNFLEISDDFFYNSLESMRAKKWPRWSGGGVCSSDGELIYMTTLLKKPTSYFESGTSVGASIAYASQAVKDLQSTNKEYKCDILTVDINKVEQALAKNHLMRRGLVKHVRFLTQDSALGTVQDYIDLAFIDSLHTYDHVKKEWSALSIKAKENSLFMFHDAHCLEYGINKFLKEFNKEDVLILPTQECAGFGFLKVRK